MTEPFIDSGDNEEELKLWRQAYEALLKYEPHSLTKGHFYREGSMCAVGVLLGPDAARSLQRAVNDAEACGAELFWVKYVQERWLDSDALDTLTALTGVNDGYRGDVETRYWLCLTYTRLRTEGKNVRYTETPRYLHDLYSQAVAWGYPIKALEGETDEGTEDQ